MKRESITAERLREALCYDMATGIFTRRIAAGSHGRIKAGTVAGCTRKDGYLCICCDGTQYLGHRLAWLYVYGEWPKAVIDHIDGNPSNNRISNLREATQAENVQNQRGPNLDSKTGSLGVTTHQSYRGKFKAQIVINKKTIYLGLYDTAELAHNAYIKAKRELHPGCTL